MSNYQAEGNLKSWFSKGTLRSPHPPVVLQSDVRVPFKNAINSGFGILVISPEYCSSQRLFSGLDWIEMLRFVDENGAAISWNKFRSPNNPKPIHQLLAVYTSSDFTDGCFFKRGGFPFSFRIISYGFPGWQFVCFFLMCCVIGKIQGDNNSHQGKKLVLQSNLQKKHPPHAIASFLLKETNQLCPLGNTWYTPVI